MKPLLSQRNYYAADGRFRPMYRFALRLQFILILLIGISFFAAIALDGRMGIGGRVLMIVAGSLFGCLVGWMAFAGRELEFLRRLYSVTWGALLRDPGPWKRHTRP
jgi:hypothetical protein